jgi:hypothetical protein
VVLLADLDLDGFRLLVNPERGGLRTLYRYR